MDGDTTQNINERNEEEKELILFLRKMVSWAHPGWLEPPLTQKSAWPFGPHCPRIPAPVCKTSTNSASVWSKSRERLLPMQNSIVGSRPKKIYKSCIQE